MLVELMQFDGKERVMDYLRRISSEKSTGGDNTDE
jgi:hypothetical protein